MKRLHIHIAVESLTQSIDFYSHLFAAEPTVRETDYAKWMLDDPRVNFAISQRGAPPGLDHLGIQVESGAELAAMGARLGAIDAPQRKQTGTTCCYAESDKHWVTDPQGIAWESFHTLASAPVYARQDQACCAPTAASPGVPTRQAVHAGCGAASTDTTTGSDCC